MALFFVLNNRKDYLAAEAAASEAGAASTAEAAASVAAEASTVAAEAAAVASEAATVASEAAASAAGASSVFLAQPTKAKVVATAAAIAIFLNNMASLSKI
jgi:hypothetical protein